MPAMNRDELMLRIQALEFTAVDLNLYLDTHPCDARALAAAGYRLDWVQVVDQFRWSTHVELVSRFSLT